MSSRSFISSLLSLLQEYVGRPMPSTYLALEKALQAQCKVRMPPILTWREYRDLAHLSQIEVEGDDLITATTLLHNLGSLVYFANEEKVCRRDLSVDSRRIAHMCEPQLRDVVILDPQWLMDVMSTIVSTKHSFCWYEVVSQPRERLSPSFDI